MHHSLGRGVNWNKSLSTENTFPRGRRGEASNGYFILFFSFRNPDTFAENRGEACGENLSEAGYGKLLR